MDKEGFAIFIVIKNFHISIVKNSLATCCLLCLQCFISLSLSHLLAKLFSA